MHVAITIKLVSITDETDCIKAQNKYDADRLNGTIGTYVPRPNCDVNGNFVSSKCQPDSRYVINPFRF